MKSAIACEQFLVALAQNSPLGTETGECLNDDSKWVLLEAFLEFALGNTGHWDYWEKSYADDKLFAEQSWGVDGLVPPPEFVYADQASFVLMSRFELELLHARWAAVHLCVEVAGWYPWSMADFGESEIVKLASWQEYRLIHWDACLDSIKNLDWKVPLADLNSYLLPTGMSIEECEQAVSVPFDFDSCCRKAYQLTEGGWYRVDRIYTNPAAAALFARDELFSVLEPSCSAVPASTETGKPLSLPHALCSVLEWYRGPANRYDGCCRMECAEQFQGDPEQYCVLDGTQPWSHIWQGTYGDSSASMGQWQYWMDKYGSNPPSDSPRNFRVLKKLKIGGCTTAANFFAATLCAMNIPATVASPIWASGSSKTDWSVNFSHATVSIAGIWAVRHGDDLWGPGASLFRWDQLLLPHGTVLRANKLYLDKLKYTKQWFNLLAEYNMATTTEPSEGQLQWGLMVQTARHSKYWIARKYYWAMLKSYSDPRYTQVLLDALFYLVVPYEATGQGWAGEGTILYAMKLWMLWIPNPYESPLPLPSGITKDDVEPQLRRDDWMLTRTGGLIVPANLWWEPYTKAKLAEIVKAMFLEEYAVQNGLKFTDYC